MQSNQEESSLVKLQNSENSKLSLDPKTHLQSLGFIINNGKARFILEDDTPIYSNAALTNFSIADPNDTLSFVVLGKDSMDFIQASSIASYVDIECKSMSVDYNSMIASWNSNEIHDKLSELLQENGKLKETLKQNNIAMKQQFNTLASWQEEIMKIHQNHKKKFAETRELINYLKKENSELKMRVATGSMSTEPGYEMLSINEMQSTSSKKESSIPETELQDKVSSLTEKLSNSQQKCEKLTSVVEKLLSISNLMSSQLKQATSTIQEQRLKVKKLEVQVSMLKSYDSDCFNQSINYDTPKNVEYINKCTDYEKCLLKNEEINSLKESLAVLEYKLQYQNTQRLQQCKEILQDLKTCFDKQIDHCATIEKYVGEFIEAIECAELVGSYSLQNHNFDYVLNSGSLDNCHKKLIEERQKLIEEKENTLVVQNQLLKAMLNHNSILCESDIVLREKTEQGTSQTNVITDSIKKMTVSVEEDTENKQLLEETMNLLVKEKESLKEKEQLLDSQKKNLEMELQNLTEAKEMLQQERISLREEKSSLDQQSQLYENHYKTILETEKKKCDAKYNQLISELCILHDTVQKKELCIKELETEMKQQEENIILLRTQLVLYEEDFKQERRQKEQILAEKDELNTSLQEQIKFNQELQQNITVLSSE